MNSFCLGWQSIASFQCLNQPENVCLMPSLTAAACMFPLVNTAHHATFPSFFLIMSVFLVICHVFLGKLHFPDRLTHCLFHFGYVILVVYISHDTFLAADRLKCLYFERTGHFYQFEMFFLFKCISNL